tara:strand:+ start:766 stop:942 length:177 start_codon:yes stop_codon:yes gene_type:complete
MNEVVFKFLDKVHLEKDFDYVGRLLTEYKITKEQAEKYQFDWVCEKMKKIPFGTEGCL